MADDYDAIFERLCQSTAKNAALTEAVRVLSEALEPFTFSRMTKDHVMNWHEDTDVEVRFPGRNCINAATITIAQIRDARAALTQAKELLK